MQSRSSQPDVIALTESEAYQTLLARAHRRTGGVPPELIVRHVLSVTRRGDWPVFRDALEAVLRRVASALTRFRSSGGRGVDFWVCMRPAAADRAPGRTARCSVEPIPSTAVASAPISSGAHSGCASTSWPSSRTW